MAALVPFSTSTWTRLIPPYPGHDQGRPRMSLEHSVTDDSHSTGDCVNYIGQV